MMIDAVNRLTFEFTCQSEQTSKVVSSGISNFWIDRFNEILSRMISSSFDNDILWKIDKIEVDLGDIRLEDIGSKEIPGKFASLLAKAIEATRSRAVEKMIPAGAVHLQVLKTILLTGDLPWWMDKKGFNNLDHTIKAAIDFNFRELEDFFNSSNNPEFIRRIQMFSSPEMFSMLIGLIPGMAIHKAVGLFSNQPKFHWDKLPASRLHAIVSSLNASYKKYGLKFLLIQNLLETQRATMLHGLKLLSVFSEEQLHEIGSYLQTGNQRLKVEKWLQQLKVNQLEFLRHPELWTESSVLQNPKRKKEFSQADHVLKIRQAKQLSAEMIVNHSGFLTNNILGLLVSQVPPTGSAEIGVSDNQLNLLAFLQRVKKAHLDLRSIVKKLGRRQSAHFMNVITHQEFSSGASKKTIEVILKKLPEKDLQLITQLLLLSKNDVENITEVNLTDSFKKTIIENAGLCILAPFLPSFFNSLGFIENGKFKSKYKAHRAVYMLEYLVNGRQKNYEYSLQLNKLLCGIDPQEPITAYKRLTLFERNEAKDLITSVIEHWKALRSTSVRGLQSSFLQRKGILTEKEDQWILQVEKASYDILLDSLPWSYHHIKFSWMRKMIQPEW